MRFPDTPFPFLVALFLATSPLGFGQTTFTQIVGFVKLGNTTPGQDAVAANKDVYLTIPLEREVEFSGTVASTTTSAITVNDSPAWIVNQWASGSTPYCVIIGSGSENGLRGVVTSNTADTVTITLTTPGDLTNVSVGDALTIRECWTLQNFFPSSQITDGSQVLIWNDTLTGINQVASSTFFFGSGNWFDSLLNDANDTILHPGETFVLRTGNSAIPKLTIFGDISTSSLRNALQRDGSSDEDLFIGSMSPLPALVRDLSIPVGNGDQLLIFDPSGSGINQPASNTFFFGGNQWFNSSFQNVTDTLTVNPGAGFVLRRSSNNPAFAEWIESAP